MTETPIAERLDKLAARAEAEIRNPALAAILGGLVEIVREIDAARPPPGTLTPAELESALGGAAFLANLTRLLREIALADERNVQRVVAHVLAAARAAPPRTPQDGNGRPHP